MTVLGQPPRGAGVGREWSYEPDGALGGPFPEAKDMKLRRETIVTALVAKMIEFFGWLDPEKVLSIGKHGAVSGSGKS
jgi:hypothetical protein